MKKHPSDLSDLPISSDRRQVLQGIVGLALAAATMRAGAQKLPTSQVNTTKLAVTDTEVIVGQLHSATGTMAISETGSIQAEQLAIDQINAMGGVLGRQIKVIKEDGASDWPTFAEKAKKLLVNDHVASVFGCWTSASRKAVLPIFEKENGMLYYPTFYEGLEQSKNVIYTGQEATQQILWGLDWASKDLGTKTYFLVGSDYIWPRTSMKIARKHRAQCWTADPSAGWAMSPASVSTPPRIWGRSATGALSRPATPASPSVCANSGLMAGRSRNMPTWKAAAVRGWTRSRRRCCRSSSRCSPSISHAAAPSQRAMMPAFLVCR